MCKSCGQVALHKIPAAQPPCPCGAHCSQSCCPRAYCREGGFSHNKCIADRKNTRDERQLFDPCMSSPIPSNDIAYITGKYKRGLSQIWKKIGHHGMRAGPRELMINKRKMVSSEGRRNVHRWNESPSRPLQPTCLAGVPSGEGTADVHTAPWISRSVFLGFHQPSGPVRRAQWLPSSFPSSQLPESGPEG